MQETESNRVAGTRLFFGHPLYWLCQVLGWSGIWAISQIHLLVDPENSSVTIIQSGTLFLGLACFSHLYRFVIQLNGWCKMSWRRLLPRAVTTSLLISGIQAFLVVELFANQSGATAPEPKHFLMLLAGAFVFMSAWSAVYFGYHFQGDYQKMQVNQLRLEVALREAEHRALSAQVNPHFLFNSLNTLRSLIDENPEKAREAVTELARLFRASLKTTRENVITLREELETVRSYLSLEQARFEDRLVICGDVPTEALEATLPPFLLQTLIENAIKYGIGSDSPTEISYRARLDEGSLRLQVTNPGQVRLHSRREDDSETGIGLENSRLRLQLLFGAKAFLNLKSQSDNVVLAEAFIPQLRIAS